MDKRWCLALFFFVYPVSDYVSCTTVVGSRLIRTKRDVNCDSDLKKKVINGLADTLEEIRKLDPLNYDEEVRLNSRIFLHDGKMKGLSTVHNITELKTFCNDNEMVFSTTLRTSSVKVSSNWTRKGYIFTQRGNIWLEANYVDYSIIIHLNTTGGLKFNITNSMLSKVDDFEVGFNGLGLLNPFVRVIMRMLFRIFKDQTESLIGHILKHAIEYKLEEIVVPQNSVIGNSVSDTVTDNDFSWDF